MSESIKVMGFTRKLERGGSVSVGHAEGCTNTFIKFVNKVGVEARIRLSDQASEALRDLLQGDSSRDAEWHLVDGEWGPAP